MTFGYEQFYMTRAINKVFKGSSFKFQTKSPGYIYYSAGIVIIAVSIIPLSLYQLSIYQVTNPLSGTMYRITALIYSFASISVILFLISVKQKIASLAGISFNESADEFIPIKDDFLIVRAYAFLINHFLNNAKRFSPIFEDRVMLFFDCNPILFQGCSFDRNACVDFSPVLTNLYRIKGENRIRQIGLIFSALGSLLLNIYITLTSEEQGKKAYSDSFRASREKYGFAPSFIEIIRNLPEGLMEEEIVDYLPKDKLVSRFREQLQALEKAREYHASLMRELMMDQQQLLSIFNSIDEIIYCVDPNSYEILYANTALKRSFSRKLIGEKCYEVLQSKASPCEFCTNEIILKNPDKPYKWEYHNPVLDRDFAITDRIIKWTDGRDVRFELAMDITEQKRTMNDLELVNKDLKKEQEQRLLLSKRLIDLLENDRHQLAMELHDDIGQILTSLKIDLELIDEKLKSKDHELEPHLYTIEKKVIHALKSVKDLSRGLKPAILDSLGVVSAIKALINDIKKQTDIEIIFFNKNIPKRFHPEKELVIFRVTQEALNNIIKHSRAAKVHVNLFKKDEMLFLSVEDDGVGFDVEEIMHLSNEKPTLGLVIMRERVTQYNGEITIESGPNKGTHLLVELPF